MTTGPFVAIKDVAKRWNGQLGVEGITLDIPEGSFTALLGPSGCGKSTTLRLLAGLELPDEGQIFIDGKDVTTSAASDRNLSMVFQSYALFPHLSVVENVVFGLKVRRVPKKERQEKLHRALEITGCSAMEIENPVNCPAVNASVWLWPARLLRGNVCASWTNPCRTWMRSCAIRCAKISKSYSAIWVSRSSM